MTGPGMKRDTYSQPCRSLTRSWDDHSLPLRHSFRRRPSRDEHLVPLVDISTDGEFRQANLGIWRRFRTPMQQRSSRSDLKGKYFDAHLFPCESSADRHNALKAAALYSVILHRGVHESR